MIWGIVRALKYRVSNNESPLIALNTYMSIQLHFIWKTVGDSTGFWVDQPYAGQEHQNKAEHPIGTSQQLEI